MATFRDKISMVFGAEDKTGRVVGGLKKNLLSIAATTGAIVAVGRALKSTIDAAAESNRIYKQLEVAVNNAGQSYARVEPAIRRYTNRLQETTGESDENIAIALRLASTYGAKLPDAMKITEAALDLAVGRQVDLKAAVDLVGRAFAGETGTLKRYGIIIEEGGTKAEKFQRVLEAINESVGGAAAARIDTYAGRVERLAQKWGDLTENIGKPLVRDLSVMLDQLNETTKFMDNESVPVWQKMLTLIARFSGDPVAATQAQTNMAITNAITEAKQQEADAHILAMEATRAETEEAARIAPIVADINAKLESNLELRQRLRTVGEGQSIADIEGLTDSEFEDALGDDDLQFIIDRRFEELNEALRAETDAMAEANEGRMAALESAAQEVASITESTVTTMVDEWIFGEKRLGDVFKSMARDFVRFFASQVLNSLSGPGGLVGGIVKVLGSIFDQAHNDAQAIAQGRHYAELFAGGAQSVFENFTPAISPAGPDRALSGTSGNVTFVNPIFTRQFSREIQSNLETVGRTRRMRVPSGRVSAIVAGPVTI